MYNFFIEPTPLSGEYIQFFPFYEGCSINASLEGNLRKIISFDGQLIFCGSEYNILFSIFQTGINSLKIRVYKNTTLEISGFLILRGSFNTKEKQAKCKIINDDVYTLINKKKDTEHNILALGITPNDLSAEIKSTSITRYSNYTTQTQDDYRINTLPFSYRDLGNTYVNSSEITVTFGKKRYVWRYFVYGEYWTSEIISDNTTLSESDYIESNPSQFILDISAYTLIYTLNYGMTGHIWSYKKQMYNFNPENYDTLINYYISVGFGNYYYYPSQTQNIIIIPFTSRFLKFFDVIQKLLSIISTPTNTIHIDSNTYCTYFNMKFPKLLNLYLSQKSNIKRYKDSNPASVLNTTFQKIMEIAKQMFNLDWYIDENNYFKFKHPSEVIQETDWNFTEIPKYNNLRSFSIKETKNINSEVWNFETTVDYTFSTGIITYDAQSTEVTTYETRDVCNDIINIIGNNEISDIGFVFAVCESEYSTIIENSIASYLAENIESINGSLSYYNLIKNHQRTGDRPYSKDITMNTLGATNYNEHIEIQIPLDYISRIDMLKLVKTQLTEELGLEGARKNSISQKLDKNFATLKLDFGYFNVMQDTDFRWDTELHSFDTELYTFDYNL